MTYVKKGGFMKGNLVGYSLFNSKKDNTPWVNLFFKYDYPNSNGLCTRQLMCQASRLPMSPDKMLNKDWFVDCQNNFASDFYEVK